MAVSAINYLPPFANSLIMHVLTNAEKLIPLRDAASLAESRRLAGMRMVTGTTSPSTRYERISVSPASCSIKSEYVIASHAFKPQYKCINYTPAWEQRKLIMVAPLQRGFDLPAEKIIPGVYPVMMSNGIGAYHNEYKVKGPGVVTGRSGTIGNLQYVESAFWPHNTTLWVTKFYGNHPKFIYYLYEKIDLKRYKAGSGVPTLNRNDVHDTMVFFPASRKEQELISAVLTYLDNLITLHQRKRQWLKWLDEGGEGTHHDIDILVFKFADDMKISVLCGVHACMTKSLGHTGNRYAGKQQQRGMGVP